MMSRKKTLAAINAMVLSTTDGLVFPAPYRKDTLPLNAGSVTTHSGTPITSGPGCCTATTCSTSARTLSGRRGGR